MLHDISLGVSSAHCTGHFFDDATKGMMPRDRVLGQENMVSGGPLSFCEPSGDRPIALLREIRVMIVSRDINSVIPKPEFYTLSLSLSAREG